MKRDILSQVSPTAVAATPADVEVVAPADVVSFLREHGGAVYVWVSFHRGACCRLGFLETATVDPATGERYFRRLRADGFDLYLEARQRVWPQVIELALRRRRVVAYWNGLAWIP